MTAIHPSDLAVMRATGMSYEQLCARAADMAARYGSGELGAVQGQPGSIPVFEWIDEPGTLGEQIEYKKWPTTPSIRDAKSLGPVTPVTPPAATPAPSIAPSASNLTTSTTLAPSSPTSEPSVAPSSSSSPPPSSTPAPTPAPQLAPTPTTSTASTSITPTSAPSSASTPPASPWPWIAGGLLLLAALTS